MASAWGSTGTVTLTEPAKIVASAWGTAGTVSLRTTAPTLLWDGSAWAPHVRRFWIDDAWHEIEP